MRRPQGIDHDRVGYNGLGLVCPASHTGDARRLSDDRSDEATVFHEPERIPMVLF